MGGFYLEQSVNLKCCDCGWISEPAGVSCQRLDDQCPPGEIIEYRPKASHKDSPLMNSAIEVLDEEDLDELEELGDDEEIISEANDDQTDTPDRKMEKVEIIEEAAESEGEEKIEEEDNEDE